MNSTPLRRKAVKIQGKKIRKSRLARVVFFMMGVFFMVYAISLLFPLAWSFIVSLKDQREYTLNSPFSLPEKWLFSNYVLAFKELNIHGNNMFMLIINSLWFSIGGTVINVMICCMTAYVFSRYKFKGSHIAYSVILFIMLLPIIGSLPSRYWLLYTLKLVNSPLYLVTATGGIGFNFIVMHGFYKNLSWSYAEAAFVDGASHSKVFFKVMFPQSLAIFFSLILIQSIGMWNDYLTPLLFFPNLPTLATGLFEYESEMVRGVNIPVFFSGLMISVFPLLVLFGLFQNTMMQSVSVGGLKG